MRAAGEALLELLPDRPAIERQHLGQHPNRLVHGANRVAGYTRIQAQNRNVLVVFAQHRGANRWGTGIRRDVYN